MQKFIFDGNYSFLVTFTQDFQRVSSEVDSIFFKIYQLGAAHTGLVEHLQQQLVAAAIEVVGEEVGVVDVLGFAFGEEYRQPLRGLG